MQQQISVITLGVMDIARSRHFYVSGFGWEPVFENAEVLFFQMNGLMLGLWRREALMDDMQAARTGASAFALAHNVPDEADVVPAIDRLIAAGGALTRAADAPPHGGFRGYVTDPDGHPWEVACNPAWTVDDRGLVTFGV